MGDDDVDLADRPVCADCVGDPYLKSLITAEGQDSACHYCDETGACVSLETLSEWIAAALDAHYRRTSTEPDSFEYAMMRDSESSYDWEREGDPVGDVIAWTASVDEPLANDLREHFAEVNGDWDAEVAGEENPFDAEACYIQIKPDDEKLHRDWLAFETSLKAETRFFNKVAVDALKAVFGAATTLRAKTGEPVVRPLGPGEVIDHLFRARSFQSDGKLEAALARPVEEIGPPPMTLARAGRMNAAGISVFYGATNPTTAITEIRPPTGSKVVVARFELLRPLRVLDVAALRAVFVEGSIFDPSFADRLRHARFLESVSGRIVRPVMPDDEPFDYLPTQAIADYLASADGPGLDGMIYGSSQGGAEETNIVLFHKSARVRPLEVPQGAKIRASVGGWTEDGWEYDFRIRVELPTDEPADAPMRLYPRALRDDDSRQPALRLDPETLQIHTVLPRTVPTKSSRIAWHVTPARDRKF